MRRAVFLVVLSTTLAACRREPPELRIGLLATFTGPFAAVSGIPSREGAQLAVRETGGEIELAGRRYRIVLVERDFEDRADAAATAARSLINQDSIVALVGPQFSRHAIPVSVLAEDARVPMISPMSSNPATTRGKRFVFRLAFLDHEQGEALGRFAAEYLRARTAAVLYDVSAAYSRDVAERFRSSYSGRGGRIVAFEQFTADRMDDIRPQARRIAAARPDVVFLPVYPDAIERHFPQLLSAGVRADLLGSDSWNVASLPELAAGQRAFVTNQWRPDQPVESVQRFIDSFRAAFGRQPPATAAMTYDAVRILLDAARRAGSLEPEPLRDALAATSGYQGASGTVSFKGSPDPRRQIAVSQVEGRTLRTVRLVEPAAP